MTVETQLTLVYYEGDGIAVTFPFTFPVYDESHLRVILEDPITYAQILLNESEYSVTGVGNENGGSVVVVTPPAIGTNLLLARVLPLQQDLDVDNQGGFYPNNFERQLDITEMQIQQVDEEVGRSVRGQIGETWPELPAPPSRRGKLLSFRDDETAYPTIASDAALFNLIATILQAGFGISLTLDAVNHTITITNTEPGGGGEQECWLLENAVGGTEPGVDIEAEFVRDTIGTALVGLGITVTVDDAGDTITIDATGAATAEVVRDVIGATLVAGTNITLTVNDAGDTITINSTGGGGSFQPLSALLSGMAAVAPTAANQLIYSTGTNTFDKTTLTPFARTLLDDANAAAALLTLGISSGAIAAVFGTNSVAITIPTTFGTILIQGGIGMQGSNSHGTIVYPTSYSVAPVCVASGGSSSTGNEGGLEIYAAPTTTGVAISNSTDATCTYTWIAIGKM